MWSFKNELLFCRLVLVSNQISGKGLCALADSMKLNTTLTNVYIWSNHLEESACIVRTVLSSNVNIWGNLLEGSVCIVGTVLSSNVYIWGNLLEESTCIVRTVPQHPVLCRTSSFTRTHEEQTHSHGPILPRTPNTFTTETSDILLGVGVGAV